MWTLKRPSARWRNGPTSSSARSSESGISLDGHDLDGLFQALDRIAARRWSKFVRDVARVAEIGNGLRNEAVIQLLRIVDLVASGHAAGMEVRDPLKILLDVAAD